MKDINEKTENTLLFNVLNYNKQVQKLIMFRNSNYNNKEKPHNRYNI